jgi:molybdopterin synthase catalytic subunit
MDAAPLRVQGHARDGHGYHPGMTGETPVIDVQLRPGPVGHPRPADPPTCCGGECVFLGRTRAETHPGHGPLRLLRYEAYEPMAMRVLHELAERAVDRYGCRLVRLHHALGDVAVGEASVLVTAACPHRAEAFEACRFLIDAIKREAPIWKCETWVDGVTWSAGTVVPGER